MRCTRCNVECHCCRQSFEVTFANDNPELVMADYFRIEQGCLVFRNAASRGNSGYPEAVRIFAPGVWQTLTNKGVM